VLIFGLKGQRLASLTFLLSFSSVCYTNIRTNSAYYLQHTTDWTELNVLLYDWTRVNWAAVACMVAFDNLK